MTWKAIDGFDNLYEISSTGKVRSLKYRKSNRVRLLKIMVKKGYQYIELKQSPQYIHRLVAKAFIPNPENKPCINHKNGIRPDNRVCNLEWVTYLENNLHSIRTLNKKPLLGKHNPYSKKIHKYSITGEFLCSYNSLGEAERLTKIPIGSISKCSRGIYKHAGNYIWRLKP